MILFASIVESPDGFSHIGVKMAEFFANGQILTIFRDSIIMPKIDPILELYELFNELIGENFYKNWHLFC
jgi:hypothetical protein